LGEAGGGIPKANVWLDPARLSDIDAGWTDKVDIFVVIVY
jgi:hypothetical protein